MTRNSKLLQTLPFLFCYFMWVCSGFITRTWKRCGSAYTNRKAAMYFIKPFKRSHSTQSNSRQLQMQASDLTTKYFKLTEQLEQQQAEGAGGSSSMAGLLRTDKAWQDLRSGGWKKPPPTIVYDWSSSGLSDPPIGADSGVQPAFSQTKPSEGSDDIALFDVAVCGGTLGIFYAMALRLQGWRVCVVERGQVAGRPQEWNISEKELRVLVDMGILTESELTSIKSVVFNPNRVGFHSRAVSTTIPGTSLSTLIYENSSISNNTIDTNMGVHTGHDVWVTDVLNWGIRPDVLLSILRSKFIAAGGVIYEGAQLERVDVFDDQVQLRINLNTNVTRKDTSANTTNHLNINAHQLLRARMLFDSMGNASPISRQARGPVEPSGVCIVVGSCARGYSPERNTYSDIIYTDSTVSYTPPLNSSSPQLQIGKQSGSQSQYFWEAFPAGSGPTDRTTYLFTYLDAKPERPSVAEIFDEYWARLPQYQGVDLSQLQFIRLLYGVFPTYRASPLKSAWMRILAVGDASGVQSPLSFGGLGSLCRHIQRITGAVSEALTHDLLSAEDLGAINAYQPSLSAAWMFQRSMSVPLDRRPSPTLIVDLLANSFRSMQALGPPVLTPFLQDVIQFVPLVRTLLRAASGDPLTPVKIIPHVGVPRMADFFVHMVAMGWYTLLTTVVSPHLQTLLERTEDTTVENGKIAARIRGDADADIVDSNRIDILRNPISRYRLRRLIEAWRVGCGLDYEDHQ